LWERDGRPEDRSDEYWHRAQSEVEGEEAGPGNQNPDMLTRKTVRGSAKANLAQGLTNRDSSRQATSASLDARRSSTLTGQADADESVVEVRRLRGRLTGPLVRPWMGF
jgi:hypothetical protein